MTQTGGAEAPTTDRIRRTYLYLRIITPVPAIWLLLAIAVVWVVRGRLYDSISDYYAGPLRDVFVGALVASTVGMVAYKGSSALEDYALNFAGVNAVFVALVSNSFQAGLDTARAAEREGTPVLVPSADLLGNLRVGVVTYLVVLAGFLYVDRRFTGWTGVDWRAQTGLAKVLIVLSWGLEVILFGIVLAMVLGAETLGSWSVFTVVHFTAAVLLVLNLSFAAASRASASRLRSVRDAAPAPRSTRRGYGVITGLMWGGMAVAVVLFLAHWTWTVIAVEAWEIAVFVAYWVRTTVEEWPEVSAPTTP